MARLMQSCGRPLGKLSAIAAALFVATMAGCRMASPAPPFPASAAIVAEVASYQLVANQPGRLLVALLTGDNRWLSFGSVRVRFSYLGDGQGSSASPSMRRSTRRWSGFFRRR